MDADTAPLIYTFTTEGSSREDSNVFYANNILISGSDQDTVNKLLISYLQDGHDSHGYVVYKGEEPISPEKVVEMLHKNGIEASLPDRKMIIFEYDS